MEFTSDWVSVCVWWDWAKNMEERVKETLLSQFDPSFASFAICRWYEFGHIRFFSPNELKIQSNDSKSKKMAIELFTSD